MSPMLQISVAYQFTSNDISKNTINLSEAHDISRPHAIGLSANFQLLTHYVWHFGKRFCK